MVNVSEAVAAIHKHLRTTPQQQLRGEIIHVEQSPKGYWITLADANATAELFLPSYRAGDPAATQYVEAAATVSVKKNGDWYFLAGERLRVLSETGPLAAARARALAELQEEGLLPARAVEDFAFTEPHQVDWPGLSRVIVLTAEKSEGARDFRKKLKKFHDSKAIEYRYIRMQGEGFLTDLTYELGRIDPSEADLVFIVRGGGRGQLRAFDDVKAARAIALAKVPVVTAVGHETGGSLADAAAKWAFITPTDAGAALEQVLYRQSPAGVARAKRRAARAGGSNYAVTSAALRREAEADAGVLRDKVRKAQAAQVQAETQHKATQRQLQQAEWDYRAVWDFTDRLLRDGARERVKVRSRALSLATGGAGVLVGGAMTAGSGVWVQVATLVVLAAAVLAVFFWKGPKRAEKAPGKRALRKQATSSGEWVERCQRAKTPRELRVLLTHRPTN